MEHREIVIIGGGLSGLAAAHELEKLGFQDILLLEKDDQVGGRVTTTLEDGYRFDRGFQVFLPSYPKGREFLDYDELDLKYFEKGAIGWKNGKQLPLKDPANGFASLMNTALHGPGSMLDKWKLFLLQKRLKDDYLSVPDISTASYLEKRGFSRRMMDEFFMAFYRGVFLEDQLSTPASKFAFTFRMFIDEGAAIPALGMQQIPQTLASRLKYTEIRTRSEVKKCTREEVALTDGDLIKSNHTIIALDQSGREWLFGDRKDAHSFGVTNLYFSSNENTLGGYVHINSSGKGIINNLSCMSNISSAYAPEGKSLISVSANGFHSNLEDTVKKELNQLLGTPVSEWELLKVYEIQHALPQIPSPYAEHTIQDDGLIFCGDYMEDGSINGALKSGKRAAHALLNVPAHSELF